MEFQEDDDDFFFEAPAEDEETEKIPEIGASDLTTDISVLNASDSPTAASSTLSTTVSRLVINQLRKSKRAIDNKGPKNLDESQKSLYVAGLLRKLNSVDSFEETDVSYPYWHALAGLCSIDGGSDSVAVLAFVQEGGIALAARTLHDFMVWGRNDDDSFKIVAEILLCLVAISGCTSTINVDMECISDILGSLIDLHQWNLAKTVKIGSKESESISGNPVAIKVKMGSKLKKDVKKLSMIFPAIMPAIGATTFDTFLIEFLDEAPKSESRSEKMSVAECASNDTANSGLWKLRPRMGPAAKSPAREPESINLISKLNSATYLAIGKNHCEILAEVDSLVKSLANDGIGLESYRSKPMLGTVCLVWNDDQEEAEHAYYRGLVVSLEGGKSEVAVFAIDYGFVKRVQVASLRQATEELKQVKPAVMLCLVRDAVPAPDTAAFDGTLKVFHNLSARRTLTQPLLKRNVVDALLLIVRLIDQESVVEMGLKILTNLAAPSLEDRNVILERGTLEQLFLLGADLTERTDDDRSNSRALNLLQHVIECLTNLVKYNQTARRKLTEMKGALLPNVILSHYGKETALHQAALNLSHALFSDTFASEEYQEKVKSWVGKSQKKRECSALKKLLIDALKVKGGKVSFEASFTPEMAKSCIAVQPTAIALKPTPEVQEILSRVSVPLAGDRFYLRDAKVELASDGHWNVICDDVTDLHRLKTRFVQELCCAALNSRQRLTIYFGLEKDGRVRGIRVNQWEVDEFRVGIDWSLSRAFRPFLEPTMYNVEFVPVCVGEHQPKPVPDMFVVELQICHISTEAYQLDKDGAVYVRINDQVVQLSLQDAGEYFAHQIDMEKKKNLLRTRRQIAILKAMLEQKQNG